MTFTGQVQAQAARLVPISGQGEERRPKPTPRLIMKALQLPILSVTASQPSLVPPVEPEKPRPSIPSPYAQIVGQRAALTLAFKKEEDRRRRGPVDPYLLGYPGSGVYPWSWMP